MDVKTRFLKYVQIDTESDERNEEQTPSSQEQWTLANLLVEELKELGAEDAHTDEFCTVYAHFPATEGFEDKPAFGFIAHMDTVSPGKGVKPAVIENYDGKDVPLANGTFIKVSENPHLPSLAGRTLITSDGTTILGADDKAGIAAIMQMCENMVTSKMPHGKVCVAFTPDEEIGTGVNKFDLEEFQADYAVTVDGGAENIYEYENFNAASAKVTVHGVPAHPGSAKGIMVNAASICCEFRCMFPYDQTPEETENYEGFYHLVGIEGDVVSATATYIIRDFDSDSMARRKHRMESATRRLNEVYGEGTVTLELKDSYYNMAEIMKQHPDFLESISQAITNVGMTPETLPIRGGTDGCRISYMGLPCPNIGAGGYAFHGFHEHCTVEGMEKSAELMLELVRMYAQK